MTGFVVQIICYTEIQKQSLSSSEFLKAEFPQSTGSLFMENSYGSLSQYTYAENVQFLIHGTASYIVYKPRTILVCDYHRENQND